MLRTEQRKRLPVSLQAQLVSLFNDHMLDALPANKRRSKRNGSGVPLSAWMRGVRDRSGSLICHVKAGGASFPYQHWGHATDALADRIGVRYSVTWVQQALITEYVFARYKGRCPDTKDARIGLVTDENQMYGSRSITCIDAIRAACNKLKIAPSQIPLSALIDERLTNILLLMQLNEMLKRA